eukprot:CAMPEP_0182422812 /NCGR_PEP_ID=MMETSP1167-20130531/8612_1 /TAXON_ID=2988 /ORGANISM="Mallomonas Sp, Strain CCMP3275" /LENGTH=592 /DNA_ID=CAMNT_0024601197 /DNA_START=334 /DNA_END=2112 /DNA_ORIENTATION=+
MGACNRVTGECLCRIGYEGRACERMSCPDNCNGKGKCQSMSFYATTKDPGTGIVHPYQGIWDANMIYGCVCDTGYYGPDCSQRRCPTGDDPLTGTGTNTAANPNQFNEIQKLTCKAGGGSFTLTFRGKTTAKIPYNAKAIQIQNFLQALPTVNGAKIVMYSSQACTETGASWTVEFTQDFGHVPLMVADSTGLTFANSVLKATVILAVQVTGTKENEECSNRGICDASSGYCTCMTGYDTSNGYNLPGQRGDCGYATTTIQACPGDLACSAHGECIGDPQYRCACSAGWTGSDCSERVCPKDTSWFTLPQQPNVAHVTEQAECSDMGVCDRVTGTCICTTGFTGSSCNRVRCPGDIEDCNAHGQCFSMSTLATLANINGERQSYTYGNIPNNPKTWDAKRMYGCYCDAKWTGYDCSKRLCPFGNDPVSLLRQDEQQIITCTSNGTAGFVVFSFRDAAVAQLRYDATTLTVKTAFEKVPAIGKVAVELFDSSKPDKLCTPAGSSLLVTFLTVHGPLPLLKYTTQNIEVMTVTTYKKGNKQNLECSGRGLCDRTLGLCSCFTGFGSSNGMGGPGTLRDCGYVMPILAAGGVVQN